jgi:hypothetical protein
VADLVAERGLLERAEFERMVEQAAREGRVDL